MRPASPKLWDRTSEGGPTDKGVVTCPFALCSRRWCSPVAPSSPVPRIPIVSAEPAAAAQDVTTTLDDQTELAVTVYNSEIALVRDVRNLQLGRGIGSLRFMDIAATVNPATVHFRSLTEPSRVNVLEQNYEYDLLEPDKLLRQVCRS